MAEVFPSINDLPGSEIRALYDRSNATVTELDCGRMCAPHNPSGKPFCCDICHAVPAAYRSEWAYLEPNTDLWHAWRGDECEAASRSENRELRRSLPKSMLLLACLGPDRCQSDFRALSCCSSHSFPM